MILNQTRTQALNDLGNYTQAHVDMDISVHIYVYTNIYVHIHLYVYQNHNICTHMYTCHMCFRIHSYVHITSQGGAASAATAVLPAHHGASHANLPGAAMGRTLGIKDQKTDSQRAQHGFIP